MYGFQKILSSTTDTEDWSTGCWKCSFPITAINYIFKWIKQKTIILNCNNISLFSKFYLINAAMLSIGDLNNLTNPTFWTVLYIFLTPKNNIFYNKFHAKQKVELDPPLYGALEISYIIICWWWHYTAADTWESPLENLHFLILINLSGHNCGLSALSKHGRLIRAKPAVQEACKHAVWVHRVKVIELSQWVRDVYDRNARTFPLRNSHREGRSHTLW